MPSSYNKSNPGGLSMDARILERILLAFKEVNLEVVLAGNMGAAVHGAPVTTQDADCVIRDTELNMKKAKAAAKSLGCAFGQPFLPASDVVRLLGDGIQVDLMFAMNSRSFEHVRSRAALKSIGSVKVMVASLEDIIDSKRKANRPKDRAMLPILEETLRVRRALEELGESVAGGPASEPPEARIRPAPKKKRRR